MKKVVILSAFATPFRSGAEACAEEVAARLHGAYDITVVTARLRRDLPRVDALPSGVNVCRVGIGFPIDKWLYPLLAAWAARKLRPDLVHAVLESFAGFALVLCRATVPSARRLLTCQSTNTSLLVGLMHRSAHRVTAISRVLVERARRFGVEAVHIPNGVPLADLRAAAAAHPAVAGRVLFAGRLERMKGVDTLIDAFASIAERVPNAWLVIVGDGSQRATLEARQPILMEEGRITFRGYLPPARIVEEFASASIFCGLSRSEALGNVFLEAQAADCAVLATNVGGIPDIVIHGQTGLLISPDDVPAAAAALERLLTDDVLRNRLAHAGMRHAGVYDWGGIAVRYAAVYEEELKRGI